MPSIYNHENNTCWGVRRSTYNIFNEQLNYDANIGKSGYSNNVVNSSENNKVGNFHGSSNGYYGYHIPTNSSVNDVPMDTTSEVSSVIGCQHDNGLLIHASDQNQNSGESWGRKRCHSIGQQDSSKRIKKNDTELPNEITPAEVQSNTESTINNNLETCEEGSRMICKKMDKIEDDFEFLEFYFRQTHGCELYKFNKCSDL